MIVYEKNGILTFSNIKSDELKLEELKKASILGNKELDSRFFKLVKQEKFTTARYGYEAMFEVATDYFHDQIKLRVIPEKIKSMFDAKMAGYNFDRHMAYISQYDFKNKDNIIVSEYELLYPSVTEFFEVTMNAHHRVNSNKHSLNLKGIIKDCDKDIEQISNIIDKKEQSIVRQILYEEYPEFAIFYYEIFPYLTLENYDRYSIEDLLNLKQHTEQLRLNTKYIDEVLKFVPVAEQNSKVLSLLKINNGLNENK